MDSEKKDWQHWISVFPGNSMDAINNRLNLLNNSPTLEFIGKVVNIKFNFVVALKFESIQ